MLASRMLRDYNGLTFVFREDGYFNMTRAAKHFEKDVYEFLRLPSTKDYIDALTGFSRVRSS